MRSMFISFIILFAFLSTSYAVQLPSCTTLIGGTINFITSPKASFEWLKMNGRLKGYLKTQLGGDFHLSLDSNFNKKYRRFDLVPKSYELNKKKPPVSIAIFKGGETSEWGHGIWSVQVFFKYIPETDPHFSLIELLKAQYTKSNGSFFIGGADGSSAIGAVYKIETAQVIREQFPVITSEFLRDSGLIIFNHTGYQDENTVYTTFKSEGYLSAVSLMLKALLSIQ